MATIPIEVIVQDAEAPVVPGEDGTNNTNINTETAASVAVPDTGNGIGGIFTGSAVAIVLPAILLVLALGSIVAILVHKYVKQKNSKVTKKEKLVTSASVTIAVLAATALIGNLVIPATKAATSDISDGITPSEDKISIVVTRDGGSIEASVESAATITSTSDFGYKVLLSMAEGVETNNLYLDGDTTSQYYIAATESTELTDNTWGYALAEDGDYTAVPLVDNAAIVAQGDEAVEDEALSIYYGVKVGNDLPAGAYSGGEIEYSLEAKEPTLPISYMQDFTTLSAEEKTDLINSIPEGCQFTLKDNRDNKDYFISKLADGNVWMTQNLDLDIEADRTYTSADTDLANSTIGTSWTPTVSTSTAPSWTSSNNAPSSYDPGNLYWNGELIYNQTTCEANGGTWQLWEACSGANPTSSTGNSHYHLGNYYNWAAAVAMSDSGSYTTDQTDVNQSICPAGWRLPNLSEDKSYQNLVSLQSLTAGASGNIQNTPTYFVYGGDWNGNSYDVGVSGHYWSSVVYVSSNSYLLTFSIKDRLTSQDDENRFKGFSLRCVAR